MRVQAGIDQFAITLKQTHKTQHSCKNLTLEIDPMYSPEFNLHTSAEIASLPNKWDPFHDEFINTIKEKGMTMLHYDFKAINPEEYISDGDGGRLFFIYMDNVYAASNPDTGEIVCNTGVTLCSPYYGSDCEEIEMPSGGKKIVRMAGGIVIDMNPSPDDRIAYVSHAGSVPEVLTGFTIKPGDLVFREPATNYEYEIEGKTWYVVSQMLIEAVIDPEEVFDWSKPKKKEKNYKFVDRQAQLDEILDNRKHKKNFRMA